MKFCIQKYNIKNFLKLNKSKRRNITAIWRIQMNNDFLSIIKSSGSITAMNYSGYSKRTHQIQKKNESPENAVAQIMTLFMPYLKESISDNSYNQLQQRLGTFLKEYKNK